MNKHNSTLERWLAVPDFDGYYEVSDRGRVRSVDRVVVDKAGRVRRYRSVLLKPTPNSRGHYYVMLHRDGTRYPRGVHRLVLFTFVGPPPKGMEACHKNDVKSDNRLVNLRWDTATENMLDRVRNGIHHKSRQDRCPLGHLFVEPNLAPAQTARGWRGCLACARAHSSETYAKSRGWSFDFRAEADKHYVKIMAGEAPAGVPYKDRAVCPLEHLLVMPNLRAAAWAKGKRSCLACDRARANAQHARLRGLLFDFRDSADKHYVKIMGLGTA